ncbi:MAG: SufD family Fe-S cluster assembly protein [Rhizomicrobium sp.]
MNAVRTKAAENFRAHGVPHRRVEAWKYSDLKSVVDIDQITSSDAAKWTIDAEGVEVTDLGDGGFAGAMGEASLAFSKAGFGLRVAKAGTVRVNFFSPGQARVRIIVEPGATLDYVETAGGSGFQNIGMDVSLGEDAVLTHVRVAGKSNGVRVEDVNVAVAKRGTYRLHAAHFGSDLSRLELKVSLNGEGASVHLAGVSVLDNAHADVTTHIIHAKGDTQSTQLLKHVAGGKARAVYQGKITVAEGANGSDSRQTAKALLFDERAEADLKPELEIFADDVKCAHGAAVGDLDADSLFYLRARGIPEDEARGLLIRAFLHEAFDGVRDDLRELLWTSVEEAL